MKNKKLISFLTIMVFAIFINIASVNITYAIGTTQADTSSGANPLNLIQNPSVESVTGTLPVSWLQAGFGTNNSTFNYPVVGYNSSSATNITISTYTDGDAKWLFTEVPVTPTRSYIYTDNYISNTPTQVVAEYFDANHVHLSYAGFITVPASLLTPVNSWGSFNTTFIPPAGVAFMTVYHLLNSVGSLTTDNFSLTEVPLPKPFDKGYVSLTFDDGFLNHYQNALPILTTANIKGTFYIVSHAVSGLSIRNSSLENSVLNVPNDWIFSGGLNTISTYPVAGHTGLGAFAGSLASNTNASWRFNPIGVINDSVYSFSEWYKSTTDTELVALVTKNDGTTIQADITDSLGNTIGGTALSLPSTNNVWTQVTVNFYMPIDTKNVTVFNQVKGIGNVVVDDLSFGELGYMNGTQVKALSTAGQEIGGHTQSHKDLTSLPLVDAQSEISGGLNDILLNGGIASVLPFDYPYGTYSPSIQQIVQSLGFTSARTVIPGFNGKDTDKFALKAQSVNADTTLATVQSWVTQAMTDHTWLILVFHEIQSNLMNSPYGTTPANLQAIVDYLKTNNITTQTMSEGVSKMNGSVVVPPVVTPPVIPTPPITSESSHSSSGTFMIPIVKSEIIKPSQRLQLPGGGDVLGAQSYKFNTNLKFGMRNNSVKELQKKLKKQGIYNGPVTGYFGPLTRNMIKKYQEQNKLPATGYVGPQTRGVLNTG